MKAIFRFSNLFSVILLFSFVAEAMVSTREQGIWPEDWPKELEPLRKQARSILVGTGIQQNIYEIRFTSREEFERAWPSLQKLRTTNSPVTVYVTNSPPPKAWGSLLTNGQVAVRIYAPSEGYSGGPSSGEAQTRDCAGASKEGKMLKAGAPWPADIISANGELPEFVVYQQIDGKSRWVAADLEKDKRENKLTGFYNRARVDLELVVDGTIIDLTKLHFPRGTLVHDERFPIPDLTAKQRADLVTESHQAYRQLVTKENHASTNIPPEFWGPTIKSLKPLRVINDRVNIKIVLAERDGIEAGFYVNLPISSFHPEEKSYLEFVELSEPDGKSFGILYRYKGATNRDRTK
ncbi:MAG: hypothetical protein ABI042_14000 [Verrucomicrobiota bacterium]